MIIRETAPYHPRGAASALFSCRDSEVLVEGPAGTGKSRAVLEKVHLALLKYEGARGLIVRKTRASMTESVMVTFEQKVLPAGDPILANGGSRRVRQSYAYRNGSHLTIGGMDNPDRIMSTEYDIVAAFEATELVEDDWEKLTTRLRNGVMPYQQAIADCNPGAPSHWLNQRANAKRMTRLLSRHEDNPAVTPAYLEKLDALTGARKMRLRYGQWAAAEGIVYDGWDAGIHMVDRSYITPDLIRWYVVGVDWGFRDPGVMQVWGVTGDRQMVRVEESYHTGRTVGDFWVARAKHYNQKYKPVAFTCDPSQPGYIQDMVIAGIPAIGANNDIRPGIDRVTNRLKVGDDKRPGLVFVRDALTERDQSLVDARQPSETIEEFDSYIYADPKARKNATEKPVDYLNHGMDAMRYAVAYVDAGVAEVSVAWIEEGNNTQSGWLGEDDD